MDTVTNPAAGDLSLVKVKQETKRVLEAFLTRSLSLDEGKRIGHVGRAYHDPKKYSRRNSNEESKDGTVRKGKKSERKKNKESVKDQEEILSDEPTQESNGKWNAIHEDIRKLEDSKHDFRINIKKLLRRETHPKDKAIEKNGSTHSKSRDSIEAILDDHGKGVAKRDSMKRPKSPNPLLACTVGTSTVSIEEEQKQYEVGPHEKHVSHGSQKKPSKPFSFKKLLKKKTQKEISGTDHTPSRPDYLPVTPCYEDEHSPHPKRAGKIEDSEIYNLAAKQLETLIKHKKVKSPSVPEKFPETKPSPKTAVRLAPVPFKENNNVTTNDQPPVVDKEEVIQKLVALLQEQAVVINEQINKDPFLRNALSRMSYGSFSRLAEVFTSQAEVVPSEVGASVSPELTKIALTMELTRKVAGINSHTVHTLMGYSLQYMDMFVPWLQKQGGWENIVSNGDIADLQID
ncbi:bcl-2-like protein 12 isoform X2 [Pseudophryne corroboree]|uniref:bcl-2-like protein 12 isoform X2 n=1 Tax=Pseudophryne corroboree TaxID=495146 RepID=UPI0030818988